MKHIKFIAAALMMLTVATAACGCAKKKNDKEIIVMNGSYGTFDKEYIVENSDLIVRAKPVEVVNRYYTCPEGVSIFTGKEEDNAEVTEYQLKVEDVYKGDWKDDTINIKVYNGIGLTPEQYENGEDENTIIQNNMRTTYVDMDSEYIFGLAYSEDICGDAPGYTIVGRFEQSVDGDYIMANNGQPLRIDSDNAAQEISAIIKKEEVK